MFSRQERSQSNFSNGQKLNFGGRWQALRGFCHVHTTLFVCSDGMHACMQGTILNLMVLSQNMCNSA